MITPADISVTSTNEDLPFSHVRIKAEFLILSVGQLTLSESYPHYDEVLAAAKMRAKREVWLHLYGDLIEKVLALRSVVDGVLVTLPAGIPYHPFVEPIDAKMDDLINTLTYHG